MSALRSLLTRIGVQPAEHGLFAWGVLCLLLLGAATFGLLNTAETLFLKRVGVDAVPVVLLVSSGLLVLTTAGIGRLASADPARWLPRVLVGLALAPLPFVLLHESEEPLVLGVLVLIARQVLALGVLVFWLAMGSLVPARRAKLLFAPLAAGVTIGGALGSFGSEPTARVIGLDGLIALCSAALLAASLAGYRLRSRSVRPLDRTLGGPPPSVPGDRTGVGELLRSSRLFRLLGVALLCGGLLNPVLYFLFAAVLDAATQGPDAEQQLLNLYSLFRGWVNVAMLVSQVWLSSLLFRRLGLPLTMVLWPVSYVLGFAWLGLDFALLAALTTLGLARVAEDGITDSASRVLYNLFPDRLRNRVTGLLEGPFYRVGGALGSGMVLATLAFGGMAWVGWIALPIAVAWLASALVLWRAYPTLLLQASAEHGLAGAGSDRAALLDAATLRSLAGALADPDPRVCRAAVNLVVDGEPEVAVPLLAEAVERAAPSTRPLLVETLHARVESEPPGSLWSETATRALARTLRQLPALPAEQRADLVRVYARLSAGDDVPPAATRESTELLARTLGDRAAPVRLAAVAELHRRGAPPPGLPDLDRTLADALGARDALVRRAARKELRAILRAPDPDQRDAHWESRLRVLAVQLESRADRAETAEALRAVARSHGAAMQVVTREALRFAEDRDPRVRGALLGTAGHAGLVDEAPRLVAALGARAPEEAQGAREGLVALGPEAALPLLVGLEFGGPRRREAALSVLRELEVDAAALDTLRARQLESVRTAVVHRAAAAELPGVLASLLRRRLEERIAHGIGALLDLLSALRDESRLAELERRLRRAPGAQERDVLVEAIEALLTRDERDALIPLLEPGDWSARARDACQALDRLLPRPALAVSELRLSPDTTLRSLAEAISLEKPDLIGDPPQMPSTLEIAARLQEMPAFDRLSTPQLMALAEQLQEQKLAAGERLYAEGDEGLGLYFVLEGAVELRRGALVLERAEAGSFFGELSALDGVPRSADAVARTAARLLRLDRAELLRLVEDVPGLALALAQRLGARVRGLQDRLEDAASTLDAVAAPPEEAS